MRVGSLGRSAGLAVLWIGVSVVLWYCIFELTAEMKGCPGGPAASSSQDSSRSSKAAEDENNPCITKWTETITDKYSIMSPFKGHIDYKMYFEHYSQSDKLDRLFVIWANEGEEPPDWSAFPKVVAVVQERDSLVTSGRYKKDFSLNNRFRPYEAVRTEAVFSVDNDMLIPTEYIDFIFDSWRSFPRNIVGFSTRLALPSQDPKYAGMGKYEIHWPDWANGNVPGFHLAYNLVFTNAAMFHRDFLNDYSCRAPQEIRDMVEKIRSCEDIAMNLIVYAMYKTLPLGVVSSTNCVNNYGIVEMIKRDTGGLAKKGDEDSYPLFRGKCYKRISDWLGIDGIPVHTTALKPYNDNNLCSAHNKRKASKK